MLPAQRLQYKLHPASLYVVFSFLSSLLSNFFKHVSKRNTDYTPTLRTTFLILKREAERTLPDITSEEKETHYSLGISPATPSEK